MSLTKYAEAFEVLEARAAINSQSPRIKTSHRVAFDYTPRPGYIYVRSRAISSRCNDNFDEFPAEEIKKAYSTFVGKPVFVNHHNSDHRRARGVIIDAALHEDTNPDGSPDVWAEVLMEVDAKRFPVLAAEVLKGNIARTSMGTDVAYSVCTACGNKAATPVDYCQHIPRMKGMKIRRVNAATGQSEEVLIAERCYGLGFFENSLLVEDPADPTAFVLGVEDGSSLSAAAAKAVIEEAEHITRQAFPSVRDTMDELDGHKEHGEQRERPKPVTKHLTPAKPETGQTFQLHPTEQQKASPGFGGASQQHERDILDREEKQRERERRQIQRQHNVPVDPKGWHESSRKTAGLMDYFEVIVHHRGDEVPVVEYRSPDLLDAIEHARTIWEGERPILCCVDNAGTDTTFWQNGENTTSGRFASKEEKPTLWMTSTGWVHADKACAESRRNSMGATKAPDDALSQPWAKPCKKCLPQKTSSLDDAFQRLAAADWQSAYEVRKNLDAARSMYQGQPSTPWEIISKQTGGVVDRFSTKAEAISEAKEMYSDDQKTSSLRATAYGETKAPAKVDTMRAENCPVCGDDEAYNGDKCSVCGYMQPPSQFQDPDLNKAREMDLRQDQADLDGNGLGPDGLAEEGAPEEDLQCTNCGEVFGAEGDDDPTGPAQSPEAEADPEHPNDLAEPKDEEDPAADDDEPDDLSDLEDADDEDLFEDPDDDDDDDDEVVVEDPNVVEQDDFKKDPAAKGEGRITAEPEDDDGLGGLTIEPNMTCPVCGQGTLIPKATQPSGEPEAHEVGVDPTKAKEKVAMNQPNPAQQRRNRIVAAIQEQQGIIQAQAKTIARLEAHVGHLTQGLATMAVAANLGNHPKFAGLVRAAGLQVRADSAQNPEGAPATTTEEAKKPQATDNVENVGSAPSEVNKDVTPKAVTDVNNSDVTVNPPVLDNLQSVTAPVSGTDAPTPAAGDAAGVQRVTVGEPSNEAFDKPGDSGWKNTSSKGDEQERFVASMRLARLRINAGLEQGEDLALAQTIAASDESLGEITAQVNALSAVAAKQASAPSAEQARRLVPVRATRQQGISPASVSMQTQGSSEARPGEDEWMVGSLD